jgi:hypothetical protein
MRQNNRFLATLTPVALALTFGAGIASADTMDFNLGALNVQGFTGPYVSVDVNRTDLTHATITFDSLTNGGDIYLLTDGSSADVNVSGAFTLTNITGTQLAGFSAPTYSVANPPGTSQVDGWGRFNGVVDSSDSFSSSSNMITFLLTATGLNTWATAASVLTANNDGLLAAAHVAICAVPCSQGNGAVSTQFASNAPASVPIPAAAWLFGSGLIGLIGIARRKLAAPGLGLQGAAT